MQLADAFANCWQRENKLFVLADMYDLVILNRVFVIQKRHGINRSIDILVRASNGI